MAFVGALLTMSISLIIPALMHLKIMGPALKPWQKALDVLALVLGVVCAAVGASSAMGNIQQKMALAALGAV
jgi:amino acid permease